VTCCSWGEKQAHAVDARLVTERGPCVPSLYMSTDYNWDVCEQEAFSIESVTLSITLPNGEEVDFGSGWFVLVELEAA